MDKNKSFTLAEVLITLVIIGIIAAITVPMIMANHKRTEYSARLKKFYSTMSNAVKLAETEWGMPAYEWDYSIGAKEVFEKYLAKYLNCTLGEVKEIEYEDGYGFAPMDSELSYINIYPACFLNDGTFFGFYNMTGSTSRSGMTFDFDLNGWKNPNKQGRDIFSFQIGIAGDPSNSASENICHGFVPMTIDECGGFNEGYTREETISHCNSGNYSCTYLLFLDGWEFKNDYPHRL